LLEIQGLINFTAARFCYEALWG